VERRTSPIELLWDLVFVFAVTQVSTTMSRAHLALSGPLVAVARSGLVGLVGVCLGG